MMFAGGRSCIVWGATGQCRVVSEILFDEGCRVIQVFDNNEEVPSPLDSVPIAYGTEGFNHFVEWLNSVGAVPQEIDCVAAIGGPRGKSRKAVTQYMSQFGFFARNVIHSTAVISRTVDLGESCQLLAGSIISASVRIGAFTIVNTGACIDHDSQIGECSHIGPMASLAGGVQIGRNVFIGTNATILPGVSVGDNTIVGAGAVVTQSLESGVIVAGNPARILRKIEVS